MKLPPAHPSIGEGTAAAPAPTDRIGIVGIAPVLGRKTALIFDDLARHLDVVALLSPRISRRREIAILAANLHRSPAVWRARAGFSPARFRALTDAADRILRPHVDHADVIVQSQTLFAPGRSPVRRPYVIYTDANHALRERHQPGGLATRRRAREEKKRLEAEVSTGAAVVFAWSEFARRSFIEDYGADPDRVIVVGAGTRMLSPSLPPRRAEDRRRALFVGFDFRRKGGDALLAAWPAVHAELPEAELLIVGPPRRDSGIAGVRFLGAVTDPRQLADLYLRATVFVMPTEYEPWGFVYHEAMAHGVPCIGTDAFAVPEIIEDGVTGTLVPLGDRAALAEAMIGLLGDPDRAAAMGREAHARVLADHTWARVVERMVPHIRRAAGASDAAHGAPPA